MECWGSETGLFALVRDEIGCVEIWETRVGVKVPHQWSHKKHQNGRNLVYDLHMAH